jgi:hypothetical protein
MSPNQTSRRVSFLAARLLRRNAGAHDVIAADLFL